MGKGDKKTRRGKVTAGSYGKTRPRKSGTSKVAAPKVEAKAEKPKKAAKPKEEVAEEKPKTTRKKKTEEQSSVFYVKFFKIIFLQEFLQEDLLILRFVFGFRHQERFLGYLQVHHQIVDRLKHFLKYH